MATELTDLSVKNWTPTDKRQEVADAKVRGLYLIVQTNGKKSWAVRYRFGGRLLKLTIGAYPTFSLKQAREEAGKAFRMLGGVSPQDPRALQKETRRKAQRAGAQDPDLFRLVAERYLREYASKRKGFLEKARLLGMKPDRVSGANWELIKGGPAEAWKDRLIQDVGRRDIKEHLDRMVPNAKFGANRKFAELRKFFNWAVSKDILTTSPVAGMAPPTDMQDEAARRRDRTLMRVATVPDSADDELRWLWRACEVEGYPFGPLTQLLVLTGQRRSEVGDMTWNEIDLDKRQWTIPGPRTKNGKPHMVPLSDAALSIIEKLPRIEGKAGYVFTTSGKTPVSGYSRMKLRLDRLLLEAAQESRDEPVSIADWRLHDLRRTVAAGLQRLGISLPVTEKVLNHTSGSFAGIVGVYQVHDYAEEKAAALQGWGRFVTGLVSNKQSNVVPLRA
ncbi:DNA integrase [Mesorhizobium sp. LNHC252B00]|uniref:tyrosine-type recombinase/integrase n=1 Tax=Mesorhizobium sp. LNHC252B00 TaxID=1287252 RepID=UPI0003CE1795|nr:site-specific integrase [Mesorhizobium sp. LNHC252B00]ESY72551.1 DNA integrase [Mesorhizobium sp. LNHC252B00]